MKIDFELLFVFWVLIYFFYLTDATFILPDLAALVSAL